MPLHSPVSFCQPCGLLVLGLVLSAAAGDSARGEDRSDLPLSKVIIGHWRTHSGKAEYYFAVDGNLVMTEDNGKKQQVQTYEISDSDEVEDLLRLKVKVVATGGSHEKELRFASDRLTLMSTIRTEINGRKYVVSITWHYLDEAQRPPKQGGDEKQ